jgi:hypothetical protein
MADYTTRTWFPKLTCAQRTSLFGQSEPCPSCGAEKWHACKPAFDEGRDG